MLNFSLSGTQPYGGESFQAELNDILDHKLSFEDPIWKNVSGEGISFIKKGLKLNADLRFTAEEALQHPWILKMAFKRKNNTFIHSNQNCDGSSVEQLDFYEKALIALQAPRQLKLTREELFYYDEGSDDEQHTPDLSS
jgi:serine/threonine protein kinase